MLRHIIYAIWGLCAIAMLIEVCRGVRRNKQ